MGGSRVAVGPDENKIAALSTQMAQILEINGEAYLAYNAVYDHTRNQWLKVDTTRPSRIHAFRASGVIETYHAPAGTGPITWNLQTVLTAGGALVIGTDPTPSGPEVLRAQNARLGPTALTGRLRLSTSVAQAVDAAMYNELWLRAVAYHTAQGTATRSAMGATLTGTGKWLGGVLGPDGKIYGIPRDSTDILIIDPVAGTATRSAMGATLTGTGKWVGGVLGPDGKIYGIPQDSTDILIIDPVAGTATRSAMGATLTGTGKWAGGVLGPDGKIYGIPQNSTDILIIDPVAGTATRSAMGATLTGTLKWVGGVLGPDGKIYGIPRDSTDILIVSNTVAPALPTYLLRSPWLNKF